MHVQIKIRHSECDIIEINRIFFIKENLKYFIFGIVIFWLIIAIEGVSTYTFFMYSINSYNIAIFFSLFSFCGIVDGYFWRPFKKAKLWNEVGPKTVNYIISNFGIKIDTPGFEVDCEWSAIEKYWFINKKLIFVTRSGSYSSIPIDKFNDELQLFIQSKLKCI